MKQFLSRVAVALSVVCVMFAASQARASSISVLVDPAGSKQNNSWPMNSSGMTWQMVYDSSFFGASSLQILSFGFKGTERRLRNLWRFRRENVYDVCRAWRDVNDVC